MYSSLQEIKWYRNCHHQIFPSYCYGWKNIFPKVSRYSNIPDCVLLLVSIQKLKVKHIFSFVNRRCVTVNLCLQCKDQKADAEFLTLKIKLKIQLLQGYKMSSILLVLICAHT